MQKRLCCLFYGFDLNIWIVLGEMWADVDGGYEECLKRYVAWEGFGFEVLKSGFFKMGVM